MCIYAFGLCGIGATPTVSPVPQSCRSAAIRAAMRHCTRRFSLILRCSTPWGAECCSAATHCHIRIALYVRVQDGHRAGHGCRTATGRGMGAGRPPGGQDGHRAGHGCRTKEKRGGINRPAPPRYVSRVNFRCAGIPESIGQENPQEKPKPLAMSFGQWLQI